MPDLADKPLSIFDGHNDTILSLRETGRSFFEQSETGHVDLPRAKTGGMVGGFYAVFIPDPGIEPPDPNSDPAHWPYASVATMPAPLDQDYALKQTQIALEALTELAKTSEGQVRIVTSVEELEQALSEDVHAMELHLEGAEAIAPNLGNLQDFYDAGVRSIGPVWSRPNAFGNGVPFQFPGSPDQGPGLTDAGKALVQACGELGILVDLSHMNEAGFWDVAAISRKPLVATHSNAWALCHSTRNLTDRQLDAVKDSGGIAGLNFATGFLHPEGREKGDETTVMHMADHIDYLVDRMGIEHVALGSDFDGASIPADVNDVAGLRLLIDELRKRGCDQAALSAIGTGNWLRVFAQTWNA